MQGGKFREYGRGGEWRGLGFAGFIQAFEGETLPAGFEVGHVVGEFAFGPGGECGQPAGVVFGAELAAIPVFFMAAELPVQPLLHLLRAGRPALAQLVQGVLVRRVGVG